MASASNPVPVEHLDFAYVQSCSNVKELERILKVLKSGSEGHYPELIAATEDQLGIYNPKSLLLRHDQAAVRTSQLPEDERLNLLNDMETWSQSMSSKETGIQEQVMTHGARASPIEVPIRRQHRAVQDATSEYPAYVDLEHRSGESQQPPDEPTKAERIKAYDYRSWDRFDPDDEEDDVSSMQEKSDYEATKETGSLAAAAAMSTAQAETTSADSSETDPGQAADMQRVAKIAARHHTSLDINTKGKVQLELEQLSRIEKEKGNESYRAGDHEEAVVFYTRSLQYLPTLAAYNNRALTALKLRMYDMAERDASNVLKHEASNVKALLRRAEARQYLYKFTDAVVDVKLVLDMEPANKTAKNMLPYLEREARPVSSSADKDNSGNTTGTAVTVDADPVTPRSPSTATTGDSAAAASVTASAEGSERKDAAVANATSTTSDTSSQASDQTSKGAAQQKQQQQQHAKKKKKKGTTIKIAEVEGGGAGGGVGSGTDSSPSPTLSKSPTLSSGFLASPSKKKNKKYHEPPKCTPKTARNVQPISILKRPGASSGGASGAGGSTTTPPDGKSPSGAKRGLHWAEELTFASPTSSYSAASPTTPTTPRKGAASASGFPGPAKPSSGGDLAHDSACSDASSPLSGDGVGAKASDSSARSTADPPSSTVPDGCAQAKMASGGVLTSSSPTTAPQSVGQSSDMSGVGTSSSTTATASTPAEQSPATNTSNSPSTSVSAPVADMPLPAAVQALKDEGNSLFKAGNYQAALVKYSTALKKLGDSVDQLGGQCTLLNNRAACHSKLGDCGACVRDCTRVLDAQPGNAKAWMRRGDAYRLLERYSDAYADYQQVVTLDPSNCTNAQQAMGRLLPQLRDRFGGSWRSKLPKRPSLQSSRFTSSVPTQQAGSDVRSAAAASSSQPPQPAATASTVTAAAAAAPAGLDQADLKLKTTQTSTELYETVKQRGNDFVKKGQWNEAVYCYNSCIATDSANPIGYSNRALCYLKLEKYELAELDCISALRLDPDNVKVLYRKALAQKGLHRYSDSLESLRAVVQRERGNFAALKEVQVVGKLAKEAGQIPDSFKKSPTGAASSSTKPAESSTDGGKQSATATATSTGSAGKKKKKKGGAASPAAAAAAKEKERHRVVVTAVDRDSDEDEPKTAPVATSTTASPSSKTPAAAKTKGSTPTSKPATKPAASATSPGKKSSNDNEELKPSPASTVPQSTTKETPTPSSSKSNVKVRTAEDIEKLPSTGRQLTKGSPYEFITAWAAVKQGDKLLQYYHLLSQITPSKLPTLVGKKCNGDMVMDIVRVISQHYLPAGEYEIAYQLLSVLPTVQRFDMVVMFLSVGEKIEISRLLQDMSLVDWAKYEQQDLDNLGQVFNL